MIRSDYRQAAATVVTELTGNGVHIWQLSLLANSEVVSGDTLSKNEIRQAERFHFTTDRLKFILTRTMLRSLLSRYAGVEAKKLTLAYNRHGKPYLLNPDRDKPVFFNVTHSQDIALFAFSRQGEIGIDIEYMRDNIKYLELAQRFFSAQEYQALAQLSGNELKTGFYRCWTRKEAFIKAVGTGLSFSLGKFAVNFENNDNPKLLWADTAHFSGTCNMFPILDDEYYCAALACLCHPGQVDFYYCPQNLD